MNIKKSASFLKRKIDSFSCNLIICGEEIIGLEALRYWLRNNYRTNPIQTETYVSRELTKLYLKLEKNEDGFIQNSDHFTFMKDVDVFYTILKGLGITFEQLMEPGKSKFQPETEYEKLHNDNQEIKSLLHELTNVCTMGFTKTNRSSFEEKQKEFKSFFISQYIFINFNKKIENLGQDEKVQLQQNLRWCILMSICYISNEIMPFNDSDNLRKQDIPIEYLELQYFRVMQQSKMSVMAKILRDLTGFQRIPYYDRLVERISKEIDNYKSSPNSDNCYETNNYLLYSCNIALLDLLNRLTFAFSKSYFSNFKYKSSVQLKKKKDENNTILKFGMLPNTNLLSSLCINNFQQDSLIKQYGFQENNITRLQEMFIKKTGSLLRQLSTYLSNIKERFYSYQIVQESRELLEEYLHLVVQIIYKENWILTEDSETKISSFIDKFTQHTIIISHDMGGMNEAD